MKERRGGGSGASGAEKTTGNYQIPESNEAMVPLEDISEIGSKRRKRSSERRAAIRGVLLQKKLQGTGESEGGV